jgi:YD repeat-containing protein
VKPKVVVMILAACLLAAGLRAQSNNTVQYFYDAAGRLTSVVDTSGNVATYNYDAGAGADLVFWGLRCPGGTRFHAAQSRRSIRRTDAPFKK